MIEPSTHMREQLHALPDVPLPDTLWQRVDTERRQKLRRRKFGAGIAALALVAVLAPPLLAPLLPGADVMENRRVAVHQPVRGEHDIQAELRALDHALQVAYDRGASDAEIAPMWVARNELIANNRPRQAPAKTNRT